MKNSNNIFTKVTFIFMSVNALIKAGVNIDNLPQYSINGSKDAFIKTNDLEAIMDKMAFRQLECDVVSHWPYDGAVIAPFETKELKDIKG